MVKQEPQGPDEAPLRDSRKGRNGSTIDASLDNEKTDASVDRAHEESSTTSISTTKDAEVDGDREVFLRARRRVLARVFVWVFAVAAISFLTTAGYAGYVAADEVGSKPFSAWVWPIVGGFLGLYSLAGVVTVLANQQAAKQAAIELKAKEAVETVAREVQDDGDVINLLRLNRKEMEEYQIIARGQAKTSFMVSNLAMAAGLTLIIVGILITVLGRDLGTKVTAASLSAIAAALASFISRTFIQSRNASLDQLNYYFNQPLITSYLLQAERIAREAPEAERSRLMAAVVAQSLSNAEPVIGSRSKTNRSVRENAGSVGEQGGAAPAGQGAAAGDPVS